MGFVVVFSLLVVRTWLSPGQKKNFRGFALADTLILGVLVCLILGFPAAGIILYQGF